MSRQKKLTDEERIQAVREYLAGKGVESLTERSGKAKPEDELTEADRLRMENKIWIYLASEGLIYSA